MIRRSTNRIARFRHLLGWTLLLALSSQPLTVTAESPMVFRELGLDDGLSQSTVNDTYQDSRGFIWIATENGLNRYDGYDVLVYGREPGNPEALSSDYVWSIDEDRNGNIWLATDGGGVSVWERQTGLFRSFRHAADDPQTLSSDAIRNLLIARDGTVWIATRDAGLNRIEPGTNAVQRLDIGSDSAVGVRQMFALLEDRDGNVWAGTNDGILRWNRESDRFDHYPLDVSLRDRNILSLIEDSSGKIWAGTFEGGLVRFDPADYSVVIYRNDPDDPNSLSNDDVRAVFEDDEARLWVGTADGLNLFDRRTGNFSRYFADSDNRYSLSDDFIMSIMQDHDGMLWIGTRSGGGNRWNPRSWRFGHRHPEWMDGAYVTSFADDAAGSVWIGTIGAGGLHRVASSGDSETLESILGDQSELPDPRVMSLLYDSAHNLWIGMMTGGLARLSEDRRLTMYRHDADNRNSLSADGIMSLFEDRLGRIWIGTFGGGVNLYDPETDQIHRYPDEDELDSSLGGARATAIAEDRNGKIWIGTDGAGLILLDPTHGTMQEYVHDADSPGSLGSNTVYSILVDRSNTVWLGMAGGGLSRVDGSSANPAAVRFSHFGRSHAINDVVYGIQADNSGLLWLSTNRGLTKFDPRTEQTQTYYKSHGMQDEEFNFGAHHKSRDGRLMFGGPRGYNEFLPNVVNISDRSLPVVLTQLDVLNRPLHAAGVVPEVGAVELAYSDDVVTFGFSAVDYVDPERIRYAYRLQGFDSDFVDAGDQRRATYTNLDAGQYVFEVKATNALGEWNDVSLRVPVTVHAAPWQTVWAYAAYLAIFIGGLFWLLRHQNDRIRREEAIALNLAQEVEQRTAELHRRNVELKEASEAKSTFLARMSHEIRTPMNGVIGMTELLRATDLNDRQSEFTQTISQSAESLLQIINDILDLSKIESGELQLDDREFDLTDIVDEATGILAVAAAKKDVEILGLVDPDVPQRLRGDAYRLRQILTNLIANAVKFTDEGEVTLNARCIGGDSTTRVIRIDVTDSGIGIPEDKLQHIFHPFSQADESTTQRYGGTGLGLSICRQLVDHMGGEVGVESTLNVGSTFWCEIPFEFIGTSDADSDKPLDGQRIVIATPVRSLSGAVCRQITHRGGKAVAVASTSELRNTLDGDTQGFDSVVLDADGIDATQLFPLVRELQERSITPICLSRRAAELEDDNAAQDLNMTVVQKPVRWRSFLEKLQFESGAYPALTVANDPSAEQRRPRVLVIEDNDINQLVAEGMLGELGCDVSIAGSSKIGIAKATTESFDLVLMDAHLPDTDGFETALLIRAWEKGRSHMPIVGVSANSGNEIARQCERAGMDSFISKPYTLESLEDVVRRLVWQRPAAGPADEQSGITASRFSSVRLDDDALNEIRELESASRPGILKRALQTYLSSSQKLVGQLDEGRQNSCLRTMREASHALKSSSASIGATDFATLAAQVESACRDGNLKLARELCEDVISSLQPVHAAVNNELFRQAV